MAASPPPSSPLPISFFPTSAPLLHFSTSSGHHFSLAPASTTSGRRWNCRIAAQPPFLCRCRPNLSLVVSSPPNLPSSFSSTPAAACCAWMLEAKAVTERDAAARALAALVAPSGYRKLFKDERGIVNVVQLLDPGVRAVDKWFPVSVLLAFSQSRWCQKQMVAAGACGFLQGLLAAEVDGAKNLADSLGRGKMLGVFPRA